MKRILALVLVVMAALIGVFLFAPPKTNVIVTQVEAREVAGRPNLFMMTLTVENHGDAIALTGASSPDGHALSIMNPGHMGAPLVIPAKGKGIFAMDGAHFMLMTNKTPFGQGSLLPITLTFGDQGRVTTRVLNVGGASDDMDHGAEAGVEVTKAPQITLSQTSAMTPEGGAFALKVANFDFVANAEAPHVDNQGHAHLYLNGLKLSRLYDTTFSIGGLLPGTYELKVSLNTNDHRTYLRQGQPVEATLHLEIPDS